MSDKTSDVVDSTVEESTVVSLPSRSGNRDETGKLVTVANAALVGVPAAYAISQSVLVTTITAVAAVAFAYLARRHG